MITKPVWYTDVQGLTPNPMGSLTDLFFHPMSGWLPWPCDHGPLESEQWWKLTGIQIKNDYTVQLYGILKF